MDEDRIPDVLKFDRLGHSMAGIGGTYAHVSRTMREELVGRLQERWENALRQRAQMSPTSTVGALQELLVSQTADLRPDPSPKRLPNLAPRGRYRGLTVAGAQGRT